MTYDLIIIGGGMVGASLAAALNKQPLKIAIIDAAAQPVQDDPRLIALNASSVCLFKNLGIWSHLQPHATAIKQVHVSDRGHFGKLRIDAIGLQLSELGYVVPAKFINHALNTCIKTQENVEIFRPATFQTLTQDNDGVSLVIKQDKQLFNLKTKYVIAADGTHSTVRKQLNLQTDIIDYQQSALVTTTVLNREHQNIAYERFHATGAIAMLPLVGLRCATILTDQTTTIKTLMAYSEADFRQYLQTLFGYRLGRLIKTNQRHLYPLLMLKMKNPQSGRVILLGNAAHTLHPIAAQGLNLALAEIAKLAEVISTQIPSDQILWDDYLVWQQQQQTFSTRLSHTLPNFFSNDFFLLKAARQIGMLGLDLVNPLKNRFALKAMGKNASRPKLLKN